MVTCQRNERRAIVQACSFYPPHLGGMENVAQTIAELLSDRHDVRVLTTTCGSESAPSSENHRGVQVRRYAGFLVAHTPLSVGLALRLLVLGRREVVHVHVAQAYLPEVVLLTSTLRRRPYIAHFHLDVGPSGPFGVLLNGYKRWVLGPFLRRAAGVIALSEQQAEFLESCYGVDPKRIVIIPNGVSPAFYSPAPAVQQTSEITSPTRLLFVGRLDVQKNIPRLIDAMTRVTADVELALVGDGEQREEIAHMVDRLGLSNIKLVGAKRGAALVDWYRWADVFVMPSDKEGMPVAVLEAMAAGLAIVATDVPGTRELVDGIGLLAQPDPESLAALIDRVASDEELLADLSSRSSVRGLDFTWDSSIAKIEQLYESVAGT